MSSLVKHSAEVEFALGAWETRTNRTRTPGGYSANRPSRVLRTWSAGNADLEGGKGRTSLRGRRLPRLSKALAVLRGGCRVVTLTEGLTSPMGSSGRGI